MSIRGRLNQMQGRANALMAKAEWTLDDANEALKMGVELMDMVMDGVAIGAVLDDHAVSLLGKLIMSGKGGKLPGRLTIDLEYSKRPPAGEPILFQDGPFDGCQYKLTEKQTESLSIILDGGKLVPAVPDLNYVYVWDGYAFRYDRSIEEPDDVEGDDE